LGESGDSEMSKEVFGTEVGTQPLGKCSDKEAVGCTKRSLKRGGFFPPICMWDYNHLLWLGPKPQFSGRDMPAGERKLGSTFQKAHTFSKTHESQHAISDLHLHVLDSCRFQLHSPWRAGISFLHQPPSLLQSNVYLSRAPC
jgi:hypothetical protein